MAKIIQMPMYKIINGKDLGVVLNDKFATVQEQIPKIEDLIGYVEQRELKIINGGKD